MNKILEIKDGGFSYGNENCAIQNINVEIYQGEKIAVVGNNGAGKSTFFLTLNGVNQLETGCLFCDGELIDYKRKGLGILRRKVGMVFQDPDHQIIGATVEGEISFGPFNLGVPPEQVRGQVEQVMEETGLTALAKKPPHMLSGGEKKRVSIADIIVMKPEIILFDEPTASLDYTHVQLLKSQLETLCQKQITLMISTHDMNFVWEWADRILVFSEGEIIADDTPEHIFADKALLDRAALEKPLLCQMAELMGMDDEKMPRTLEELRKRINHL